MVHDIIDFPPELCYQIYKHCAKPDLINFACCSTNHYHSVKYLLFESIRIPWKVLETHSFQTRKLDNLKFTTVLRFSDYDLSSLFNKAVWEYISDNYQKILQHTDCEMLRILELERIIINETNTMLILLPTNLSELSLVKCFGISVMDWKHISSLTSLKKLSINQCSIDDWGVSHLTSTGLEITELELVKCTDVTEGSLRNLNGLKKVKKLKIVECQNISADGYCHLVDLKELTHLVLSEVHLTDKSVGAIALLKSLQRLHISCVPRNPYNASDIGLSKLFNLPLLEDLAVSSETIIGTSFMCFKNLKYLTHLNVSSCTNLEESGFLIIFNATKTLRKLNLSLCENLNDDVMCHIPTLMTSLDMLDVSGCALITDVSLHHISTLVHLNELYLRHCVELTDQGVHFLSPLVKMTYLDISGCYKVTDLGLFLISEYLTSLRHVILTGCTKVSEVGVSYFRRLSLLELDVSLDLYRIQGHCMQINDLCLYHASAIPTLTSLNISCCHYVTDDGMQYISQLSGLRYLAVNRCHKLSDVGLGYLSSRLHHLKHINVSMCVNITDVGIQHLCKLRSIKFINLHGCSQVSSDWPEKYPYIIFKYRLCT